MKRPAASHSSEVLAIKLLATALFCSSAWAQTAPNAPLQSQVDEAFRQTLQSPADGNATALTSGAWPIDAVLAEDEAAGFVYEGESTAVANPADDHSLNVFDEKIRGKTDQFVYRFRKPG